MKITCVSQIYKDSRKYESNIQAANIVRHVNIVDDVQAVVIVVIQQSNMAVLIHRVL